MLISFIEPYGFGHVLQLTYSSCHRTDGECNYHTLLRVLFSWHVLGSAHVLLTECKGIRDARCSHDDGLITSSIHSTRVFSGRYVITPNPRYYSVAPYPIKPRLYNITGGRAIWRLVFRTDSFFGFTIVFVTHTVHGARIAWEQLPHRFRVEFKHILLPSPAPIKRNFIKKKLNIFNYHFNLLLEFKYFILKLNEILF